MKNYYWSMESWGSDYPPENADEIISKANEMIEAFASDHGDDETAEYSEKLWERFCMTAEDVNAWLEELADDCGIC